MKYMKNIKNISHGTWIRLALLLAALTNMALTLAGKSPITSDTELANVVSIIGTVSVSLLSYWKNNSFTSAAIEADKVMREIKKSD